MPGYAFLAGRTVDPNDVAAHLIANRAVGVPYSDEMIAESTADLRVQADPNADPTGLLRRYPGAVPSGAGGGVPVTEMDALVAYLQGLGTQVKFRDISPDALRQ